MGKRVTNTGDHVTGVQAGTVRGDITVRGGRVQITGTTSDDHHGDTVTNHATGPMRGVQVGTVHGDITFG